LINAIYFLPFCCLNRNRNNIEDIHFKWNFTGFKNAFHILLTFSITTFAWIFFRAKSISDAFLYIKNMFTNLNFDSQYLNNARYSPELLWLIGAFILFEWFHKYKTEPISGKYENIKLLFCILAILALGVFSDYKEFIYFQF
jgi:alginate O-acetyltransferase complex protein AlgI